MAFLSQQNDLQANYYAQLAHNSLQTAAAYSNIVLRHIKSAQDPSTQIVSELGTTDVAIGDATAEIMITTLGKIPNEMYYLEDTTAGKIASYGTESARMMLDRSHTTLAASIENNKSDEYPERSTLLIVLLTTLLIILFMCCITACIIARSRRRRTSFLAKSDVECRPDCRGVNQPLLEKTSDATTRTSTTRD